MEDLSKLKIAKPTQGGPSGRRMPWRWVAAAALVISALLLLRTGFLVPSLTVETVTVSTVYPSQTFTLLNASGYVVAQRKAAVSSKVTGRLVSIAVEEGNRIVKDSIIARLEHDDTRTARDQAAAGLAVADASLGQAKAELKDAAVAFEREQVLSAKGYTSRSSLDAAEARYRKAEAAVRGAAAAIEASRAALRGAEVNLEYSIIRAPFDAVVLTKNADVGDIVTPIGAAANAKAAVVTIADMNSLLVEVDVSESNIAKVRKGSPAEIQLDAFPDRRFAGEVHMIVPTADRTKATVLVKVRFLERDPSFLPEMSAKVSFLERPVRAGEQKPRLAVPASAVRTAGDRTLVYRVTEDRAAEVPVKLGERLGDLVEVVEGLRPGEKIVVKPLDKVRNGGKITLTER